MRRKGGTAVEIWEQDGNRMEIKIGIRTGNKMGGLRIRWGVRALYLFISN